MIDNLCEYESNMNCGLVDGWFFYKDGNNNLRCQYQRSVAAKYEAVKIERDDTLNDIKLKMMTQYNKDEENRKKSTEFRNKSLLYISFTLGLSSFVTLFVLLITGRIV